MPRLGQVENMSIQRVMTLLALMLTSAPRIYGFQAYNCNNASAPLEQYSLLEPEPCPDILKQHELERNLESEIMQLKKERPDQMPSVQNHAVLILRVPE
jgi:hypothetical protein